jgi:hypothetical protein
VIAPCAAAIGWAGWWLAAGLAAGLLAGAASVPITTPALLNRVDRSPP